tara:strand:- start:1613 stop:2398 length:786 start_codon:yes stop_codon:yes gene_type:complete
MKIHYIDPYLQQPAHPITVGLIGCGGTGTNLVTQLARIDYSLKELGHPGLHVTVFDGDIISPSNIGRQLFSPAEIGLNKAVALVTRMNRFFGTSWKAIPQDFSTKTSVELQGHNIVITCVDSAKARIEIHEVLKNHTAKSQPSQPYKIFYWLDTGNTKDGGQVVIGSLKQIAQPDQSKFDCVGKLPHLLDLYPDIEKYDTAALQGPTCSVAQALSKQDLFINSMVAQYAGTLLMRLLKDGFTIYNGAFISLVNLHTNPIKL